MLSLLWPLVILLAILTLALLFLVTLLVTQARRSSQTQLTMLQQALSATSMTLVTQSEETRKALTEAHAKSLGATTALAEQAVRGTSSIAEQLTKTTDSLIPLLASKDPMAYSQIRQTDVALSPDATTGPYPAVDDASWEKLTAEQVAERQEASRLEAEGRKFLKDAGVDVDALGFPSVDQGQ
jgi:hypothetical protein